jgi:hypothetical protein
MPSQQRLHPGVIEVAGFYDGHRSQDVQSVGPIGRPSRIVLFANSPFNSPTSPQYAAAFGLRHHGRRIFGQQVAIAHELVSGSLYGSDVPIVIFVPLFE